eukprot:476598_1
MFDIIGTNIPNGYPVDALTYVIAVITYTFTIIVNITLLYILFSRQNSNNSSSKSVTISVVSCLSFTLGQSVFWNAGNVILWMMVSVKNDEKMHYIFMIVSTIGYVFQFLYSLAIGYYFKTILVDTFKNSNHLRVNEYYMRAYFGLYCLSCVVHNLVVVPIDGLGIRRFEKIEIYTSYQWFVISTVYNIYILIVFNKKLRKTAKIINLNVRKNSMILWIDTEHYIIKQTNLISLNVMCTLTYNIWSFSGTEGKLSLTLWHVMYALIEIISMSCILLTMKLNDGDFFNYNTFCKCCHNICSKICGFASQTDAADNDTLKNKLLNSKNVAINAGSIRLIVSSASNEKCYELSECSSFKRIHNILIQQIENDDNLLVYMRSKGYKAHELLNDFHHLAEYHDSDPQYEDIYSKLTKDLNHQNYRDCGTYSRHYLRRNSTTRSKQMVNKQKDDFDFQDVTLMSIIDKIHSYYFHSYDRNLRAQLQKAPQNDDEIEETKQDIDNKPEYNKFNLKLNNTVNTMEKHYSFGEKFEYEDLSDEWFVGSKFRDLKSELISDEKFFIELETYKEEYNKCVTFMHPNTKYFKQLSNKSRNKKQELSENHILSLLVYCNLTNYQNKWSASFRKNTNESRDSLIARHQHFRYSSKYLIELVEGFGTKLSDVSINEKA